MKRIILFALFVIGVVSAVSAQKVKYSTVDENDNYTGWYEIDRTAKKFYIDSDSQSDSENLIRNYKKSGNTESFDAYNEMMGQVIYNVKLTLDENQKGTIKLYYQGQLVGENRIRKAKPGDGNRGGGGYAPASAPKPVKDGNTVDKAKDGAKKLLNKGKNLFKKKDKK